MSKYPILFVRRNVAPSSIDTFKRMQSDATSRVPSAELVNPPQFTLLKAPLPTDRTRVAIARELALLLMKDRAKQPRNIGGGYLDYLYLHNPTASLALCFQDEDAFAERQQFRDTAIFNQHKIGRVITPIHVTFARHASHLALDSTTSAIRAPKGTVKFGEIEWRTNDDEFRRMVHSTLSNLAYEKIASEEATIIGSGSSVVRSVVPNSFPKAFLNSLQPTTLEASS